MKIEKTNLKIIPNVNGDILHGLKSSENNYYGFGEAYFSRINFGKVKAWKKHKEMTCNLIVPHGKVHFVWIEKSGSFFSETIGDKCYSRLTIPPGIWFGFMGLVKPFSLVLNISNIEHNEEEMENINQDKYIYNWREIL